MSWAELWEKEIQMRWQSCSTESHGAKWPRFSRISVLEQIKLSCRYSCQEGQQDLHSRCRTQLSCLYSKTQITCTRKSIVSCRVSVFAAMRCLKASPIAIVRTRSLKLRHRLRTKKSFTDKLRHAYTTTLPQSNQLTHLNNLTTYLHSPTCNHSTQSICSSFTISS